MAMAMANGRIFAEARLYHYAKTMLRPKPSAVRRLREPRRTVEVACYLRWQLLRVTDTILDLADHRVADLWRGAWAAILDLNRRLLEISRFSTWATVPRSRVWLAATFDLGLNGLPVAILRPANLGP